MYISSKNVTKTCVINENQHIDAYSHYEVGPITRPAMLELTDNSKSTYMLDGARHQ